MWARVTRYQFPPARVDDVVAQFDEAVDVFLEEPGLVRIDVYANRRSGAAITVTTWQSEDAMRASEDAADRLRSGVALEVAGWVQAIEEYEVARAEAAGD